MDKAQGVVMQRRLSEGSYQPAVTLGDDNDGGYADETTAQVEHELLSKQGTMVFCFECGVQVPHTTEVCSECGTRILNRDYTASFDDTETPEGTTVQEDKSSFNPFRNMKSLRELVSPAQVPAPQASTATPARYAGSDGLGNSPTARQVYEVALKPGKSGIAFDEDWLGKQLVVDDLPQEEFLVEGACSGELHCGDLVLSINGESCVGVCFDRLQEILKKAEAGTAPFKIRLRQPAASKEEAFGSVYGDSSTSEALSVIYKLKSENYEPPDHMDMVYGYVMRFRGELQVSFHFYRESDNKFLLAACMPRSGKGRVVFHNDPSIKFDGQINDIPVHSESAKYLGSMVPNFFGTAFTVHDYRINNPLSTRRKVHHELAFVAYQVNMFGRVPNTLEATLPRWDPEQGLSGQRYSLSARYASQTRTRLQQGLGIVQRLRAKKTDEYQAVELDDEEDLLTFETKKPTWNEDLQAWTLNFNGRVKMASKKNFMLVPNAKNETMDEEFGSETVCLRFGKVLKDRFSLDFRHPISPFQALAISLSSFTNKLVVT